MSAIVDQRRSANARRILRMGGVVAADPGMDTSAMEDLFAASGCDDDPRVIRDATGQVIRRL